MRKILMAAGLGMSALLVGCSSMSSLNPFAAKAPKHEPAALVDVRPTFGVKNVWSTSVGKGGDYVFSPVFVQGSIFTAAADGSVTRVSVTTGAVEWRVNAGVSLVGGVGSDGNAVAVTGEKGMLVVFDGDGKLLWKVQASSEILSAPAVGQGLVVVRSVDSVDAREASAVEVPWKMLHRIAERITSLPDVNRCLYDLTPKPPATIEYV